MLRFILNDKEQCTDVPSGMLLLDYIRYYKNLTGTKIGCREGDCGACTVLIGELTGETVTYRSFTSCLTPVGNIQGKHVVTIEGVNMTGLNPVQKAMADCSATQCGFCTPGFVMSFAGYCLSKKEATRQNAIAAIDGNICRCTGYKSIERAAEQITTLLAKRGDEEPLQFVTANNILPPYFGNIKERLQQLSLQLNGAMSTPNGSALFVGGGTDLYVQQHEEMKYADINFMSADTAFKKIRRSGNRCIIGPSVTVTDLQESELIQQYFPNFNQQVKLVSSTPIRNMATVAGNLINASPIGDFTIFFLALNATLLLSDGENERSLPLRDLYLGYKTLHKKPEEFIAEISFDLPGAGSLVSFEKVSKRTHLDIASVNSAMALTMSEMVIKQAGLSAGGVAAVPTFLKNTSAFLEGRPVSEALIIEAVEVAQTEISPISDARGTAAYKRLLLSQLIKAHFIKLFPQLQVAKLLSGRVV